MPEQNQFDYNVAFSRNIGWFTEKEQAYLRQCRVAVGGLGGVGGSHLITLARLGIGKFTITDLDTFDWPNLNRQAGASCSTMGLPKLDVMARQVLDINPEADLKLMPNGLSLDNIDDFLDGVDLYMDSLDIFALDIRRKVFARCRERGIPAVTAAPMGMGTAMLAFHPQGMSFEDYFALDGFAFEDQILKFIVGVSPSMQQRHYLLERGSVNLFKKKVPSTAIGIELAAGVACSNAIKLILKRGDVIVAPRGLHFDAYRNTMIRTWRPFGNRNPMQRFMFWYIKRLLSK
ncbi:ThiF family adenylyltransferase [Azoarcus indigens]|uniref:ThiF family protein n=1 Tax=Azoarcus indigens TaxID=29545 RepID=A0A4R6DIN0_9RHOO|nr:ThiF family adenylyltransferase [Azoarcus indigens]NMG67225.1 ThiF family adenylyltransferase [Azoarcus indigens]TDN44500.1 ThiF family protein [Azoarcus indigens]